MRESSAAGKFAGAFRKAGTWMVLVGIVCAVPAWAGKAIDTPKEKIAPNPIIDRTLYKTAALHHFPEGAPAPADSSAPAAEAAAPAPTSQAPRDTEYRIGPGDQLEFMNYDDPTLSREAVLVRYDGMLSLPLIPDINVKDLTRTEAEAAVKKAYESVFRDPKLSLAVRDAVSKTFYVMGEVNQPNEFPYRRQMTVLEAINGAGGLRISTRGGDSYVGAQGQLTKALIIRHENGQRTVTTLDMRNLGKPGTHAGDTIIYPGDVVYVPEGVNLVYLIGEVRRADVFQLSEGMTLLKLLARAGGVVPSSARLGHVVLMRQKDSENTEILLVDARIILKTGHDVPLQAGDVIYIPRKRSVELNEAVNRIVGTVSPLLSLYSQAFDAYYTDQRYDQLFSSQGSTNNTLSILQNLRDFGGLVGSIPTATVTP